MPIRPENKARYPRNWKSEVVPRIRQRSGNRCECTGHCGKPHDGRCARYHREPGFYDELGEWQRHRPMFDGRRKIITIILTVAHLNHTPEDCGDDNLLHMCQACHLRYDAPRKHEEMRARRHSARAVRDMFCEEA